jgi:hypothetical protein
MWQGNRLTRVTLFGAVVAVLIALGIYAAALQRSPPTAGGGGFRDVAREAGLSFRMSFLPAEQGQNFKINLYDHGCGVAVGDYDGDGFDDVYLVNQLGANALFRNKGDGTFSDS